MTTRWLPVLSLLLFTGCAGKLGRAVHSYRESRYPDAMGSFRELEQQSSSWSHDEQIRYALYRGLTHLAVGDARAASHWLGLARREPELLSRGDRQRLSAAWRSLGYMPGEASRY